MVLALPRGIAGDHGISSRAIQRHTEQVFRRPQLASKQNPCDDGKHPLVSFVHLDVVKVSGTGILDPVLE